MLHTSFRIPADWYTLHFDVTDSTMLRLREPQIQERPEEFVLVTADYQTAGRGQKGTIWEADAGKNLLCGFRFHPEQVPASHQFALSESLALAVADALQHFTDNIFIKWPNDIYWREKKICGMLLEHDLCGSHIATTLTGIGVNINQQSFHSDAPNPVSLLQIVGHEVDRNRVLQTILQQFCFYYRRLQQGDYESVHTSYMKRLFRRQGWHAYRDVEGEFRAEIVSISPMGMLTLRKENGDLRDYAFKQISYIL